MEKTSFSPEGRRERNLLEDLGRRGLAPGTDISYLINIIEMHNFIREKEV
jgi:hypothetical protein